LARSQCSEEIVVLGILRVVEEIRLRKPDARIVINSLLPMIDFQSFQQPKMSDFADFRRKKENTMRESIEVKNAKEKFVRAKAAKEIAATTAVKGVGGAAGAKRPGEQRRQMQEKKGPSQNMKGQSQERAKKREMKGIQKEGARKGNKRQEMKRQREEMMRRKRMEGGKEWKRKKRGESEDNSAEGPALTKALEKKEKKLDKMDKKNRNKVFKDTEKYHPKKPVAKVLPFIKKRVLPPVWPSVHLINAQLKKFCSQHEFITFFDATSIFATNEGPGGHRLKNELISPRGHPSEYGFAMWEGNIMGRLQQLLHDRPEAKTESVDKAAAEDVSDGEDVDKASAEEDSDAKDADEVSAEEDGDGGDHVSEGKEAEAPPVTEQPSRSSPPNIENPPDEKKPSGKEDSEKKPSGTEATGKEPSVREDSERKPSGTEDSGKKPSGREDSGKKRSDIKASGRDHVSEGKEAEAPLATEQPSRSSPSNIENPPDEKKPSGKEDSEKKPSGTEATGKYPEEDSERKPSGTEDSGKKASGREDSGKKRSDKKASRKEPSGREASGKEPSGREASGKEASGSGQKEDSSGGKKASREDSSDSEN